MKENYSYILVYKCPQNKNCKVFVSDLNKRKTQRPHAKQKQTQYNVYQRQLISAEGLH